MKEDVLREVAKIANDLAKIAKKKKGLNTEEKIQLTVALNIINGIIAKNIQKRGEIKKE
ncbi:hypothetical protein [Thermosipho melanesiensis]|uniref:Uncharacterized protein n=1 Tax=Thermosipho melanesiensis (strain DSM 12029 / CIP 104789 / BI429) TaxID=391009 RepID=A6LN14_THEM4|nr:hypothetical protein [Thermosipho melanesiensis]ABR31315.1 hypothetical protein Tmel_1468 [Thermosipho melanesiensis BI429]